jgi:hypothetical protein
MKIKSYSMLHFDTGLKVGHAEMLYITEEVSGERYTIPSFYEDQDGMTFQACKNGMTRKTISGNCSKRNNYSANVL